MMVPVLGHSTLLTVPPLPVNVPSGRCTSHHHSVRHGVQCAYLDRRAIVVRIDLPPLGAILARIKLVVISSRWTQFVRKSQARLKCTHSQVAQMRTVLSQEPEQSISPVGCTATVLTAATCPRKINELQAR